MAWARLDDNFHDHPKTASLPNKPLAAPARLAAAGLYALCLTWAHGISRNAREPGLIPWAHIDKEGQKSARLLAGLLVDAGLWDADEQERGCWIHDFHDYTPTREKLAEAGKRGARKRWDGAA